MKKAKKLLNQEKDASTEELKDRIKETYEEKLSLGKRPNQLMEECIENLDEARQESIKMVSLIREFDYLSDSQRRTEVEQKCKLKSYQLLKSSKGVINWLDRNASGLNLKQNLIEKAASESNLSMLSDKYTFYFMSIIILDSIKHKKLAEIVCKLDTKFSQIAANVHCICKQVDPTPYSAFFLVENTMICNTETMNSNPDIQ